MTDRTKEILVEMLTENTGRHMLDSGGAYGRNWERNIAVDLEKSAPAAVEFRVWKRDSGSELECSFTVNVFHFLSDALTYEPEADEKFAAWAAQPANEDKHWLELMDEFAKDICEGAGIYGDGKPMTVNTYNGEDALSQTIQYTYFTCDDVFNDPEAEEPELFLAAGEYVLLQIHGGCDVRGGYTRPRLFSCQSELSIMENARGGLAEEGGDWSWYTDDAGAHWYGNYYQVKLPLLGTSDWASVPDLRDLPVTTEPSLCGDGVHVYVDEEEHTAYSPNGLKLVAYMN